MSRAVSIVAMVLLAALGFSALMHFWPDQKYQQSQAVFSYLQLVVTLILAMLTYWYVSATNSLVAAQNTPPSIKVTLVTQHLGSSPTVTFQFSLTIANPSTRGTGVEAESVTINGVMARSVLFAGMRKHALLDAGSVQEFALDAEFDSPPRLAGNQVCRGISFR